MGQEHIRDGAVAQQAWGEGHLQGEPVLGLANVENVAGIRRTC